MKFIKKPYDRGWKKFFAWEPVVVETFKDGSKDIRWLEFVERKHEPNFQYSYRALKK